MRSEWPPMYFVVLWTTIDAPKVRGFWRQGDAKVLSTTSVRSWSEAKFATFLMSRIVMRGFVGDSIQIIFVLSLRTAFSSSASLLASDMVKDTPYFEKTRPKSL